MFNQCNVQKTLEFLNRSICSGTLRRLVKNETARLDKSEFGIIYLCSDSALYRTTVIYVLLKSPFQCLTIVFKTRAER